MYSNFFRSLLEPFRVSPQDAASQEDLRYYYGNKLPNAVLSGKDRNIPLDLPTTTYMGNLMGNDNLNRRSKTLDDKFLLPNNALTKDLFVQRQAACSSKSNGDTLAQLTSLANSVDPNASLRCGWMYNTQNPDQGAGAYGTANGPIKSNATGVWMWNVQLAKQKYHKYLCSQVQHCGDIANPRYAGKCGWCSSSSSAVPIAGGQVAYPHDATATCSAKALATTSGGCAAPAAPSRPGAPANNAYPADVCNPRANGTLSRSCLISKAEQAGCSDDGAIIDSLLTGSDTNYLDTLSQAQAYSIYQQRAAVNLNEGSLKSGAMTVSDALTEFQRVADNSASTANLGLAAAATDLCYTKGSMADYDFCTELQPTATAPFSLECLQKAFLRAGGQQTGTMYPSPNTMNKWNKYNTWLEVQNAISALSTASASPSRRVQQAAITKFYGIELEDQSQVFLGNIPNLEIFWFTPDNDIRNVNTTFNTTFLGRRIRSQVPLIVGASGLRGAQSTQGSFVFITNIVVPSQLSFNIRSTTDSGFVISNKPLATQYSGTGKDVANQEFSGLLPTYSPVHQVTTASPWSVGPSRPTNPMYGYYLGNGTLFKLEYMAVSNIPGECGCYGTPSADNGRTRRYTKDECESGMGGRHFAGECIIGNGRDGTYDTFCSGLNAQSPCANQWSQMPGSILCLTQDPFAPMLSFEVRQDYTSYGCDFAFCDKRLGSHKMKWQNHTWGGPQVNFVGTSKDTNQYVLGKSFMTFTNRCAINSMFLIKLYSFVTLTMVVRFQSVPAPGTIESPLIFWGSSGFYPSIRITGIGNNQATVNVGVPEFMKASNPPRPAGNPEPSSDGPTITAGNTYMLTLNMIRTNPSDIYSLNAISVGAALLSELQNDPSSIQTSSPVTYSPNTTLENPDSSASSFIWVRVDGTMTYDLFSVQLYDYPLAGTYLQAAALDNWAQLVGNQGQK
jgi:hypothetical protein